VVFGEPGQRLVARPAIFAVSALGDNIGTEFSDSRPDLALDLLANSWKKFRNRDFVNRAARDRNTKRR
jgi:hypothetical protein